MLNLFFMIAAFVAALAGCSEDSSPPAKTQAQGRQTDEITPGGSVARGAMVSGNTNSSMGLKMESGGADR
jgi:hypothetical protein